MASTILGARATKTDSSDMAEDLVDYVGYSTGNINVSCTRYP